MKRVVVVTFTPAGVIWRNGAKISLAERLELSRAEWARIYLGARERGRIAGALFRSAGTARDGRKLCPQMLLRMDCLFQAAEALPRDPSALGWQDGFDADSLVRLEDCP
jgi:hypothetical protein